MITFYPSKTHDRLNGLPFSPESITNRAMVNPCYPLKMLTPGATYICDSGAFQDAGRLRLTPEKALSRQLAFESRLRGLNNLPDEWGFDGVVTYDQMLGVDEQMVNGVKVKVRGTRESAQSAVDETIRAANHYAGERERIRGALYFACQGIDPTQYTECVREILPLMCETDVLTFGGFCIIGRNRSLKPLFYQTLRDVIPLALAHGVTRFHVLGVCDSAAIREAHMITTGLGVGLDTDSSSIEVNSVMGRVFECGKWTKMWGKEHKLREYHPNHLAHDNIRRYDEWVRSL